VHTVKKKQRKNIMATKWHTKLSIWAKQIVRNCIWKVYAGEKRFSEIVPGKFVCKFVFRT